MSLECDGGISALKQGVRSTVDQLAWRVVSSERLLCGDNAPTPDPATEKSRPKGPNGSRKDRLRMPESTKACCGRALHGWTIHLA